MQYKQNMNCILWYYDENNKFCLPAQQKVVLLS